MAKSKKGKDARAPRAIVMLATPSYDGKVFANYHVSALSCLATCEHEGIQIKPYIPTGCSDVNLARCGALNDFIGNPDYADCTHLFFIDSDHGWEHDMIPRIVGMEVPVAVASYPLRNIDGYWSTNLVPWDFNEGGSPKLGRQPQVIKGRFLEAYEAGTGFMCIERRVIEKLKEHPDVLWIDFGLQTAGKNGGWLFVSWKVVRDHETGKTRLLFDDFGLCARIRESGFPIFVDPFHRVSHTGRVVTLEGTYADIIGLTIPPQEFSPQAAQYLAEKQAEMKAKGLLVDEEPEAEVGAA